jgi:very-long-chain enoyl-CoA reductase
VQNTSVGSRATDKQCLDACSTHVCRKQSKCLAMLFLYASSRACCSVQLGNLISHLHLAALRRNTKEGYSIPRGFLFNYVTCANYTFEIWGWLLFTAATRSLPAAIFGACGAAQMVQWALSKHRRLTKLFDGKDGRDKYPRRWVILPPVL